MTNTETPNIDLEDQPSVISIVPIELFEERYLEKAVKKLPTGMCGKQGFQYLPLSPNEDEDGSKDEIGGKIQKNIEKIFGDDTTITKDFKLYTFQNSIHEVKFSCNSCQELNKGTRCKICIKQEIMLAKLQTGLAFIVMAQLKGEYRCPKLTDKEPQTTTLLKKIREHQNKTLKKFGESADGEKSTNTLHQYLEIIDKSLGRRGKKNLLNESIEPAYVFSFYIHPSEGNSDRAEGDSDRADTLPEQYKGTFKTLFDFKIIGKIDDSESKWLEKKGTKFLRLEEQKVLGPPYLFTNWSTLLLILDSGEIDRAYDIILIEAMLQILWNRTEVFSKVIQAHTKNARKHYPKNNINKLYFKLIEIRTTSFQAVTSQYRRGRYLDILKNISHTAGFPDITEKLTIATEELKFIIVSRKTSVQIISLFLLGFLTLGTGLITLGVGFLTNKYTQFTNISILQHWNIFTLIGAGFLFIGFLGLVFVFQMSYLNKRFQKLSTSNHYKKIKSCLNKFWDKFKNEGTSKHNQSRKE